MRNKHSKATNKRCYLSGVFVLHCSNFPPADFSDMQLMSGLETISLGLRDVSKYFVEVPGIENLGVEGRRVIKDA